MYGYICIEKLTKALADALTKSGYETVAPLLDPRMDIKMPSNGYAESLYTSNWSERHVAFAAGLGTFGLHTNIITEKVG